MMAFPIFAPVDFGDTSLSTGANAKIENTIIQLYKSRCKNGLHSLKNQNSPLRNIPCGRG